MKQLIRLAVLSLVLLTAPGCGEQPGHSVTTLDQLIGQPYGYARKTYFRAPPDTHYLLSSRRPLNEFDGGILAKKAVLTDSIVQVYTWRYAGYNKTIWVGSTKRGEQIIDAIRYPASFQF